MLVPRDDQAPVIAFLANPATYGVEKVERIDTHISSVFLAGQRAYKLKRAVSFSYLDFSTVERRRAACENELRLNRRTAPELYLAVEPVCRAGADSLRLGGPGEAIDYVVVMRRFSQDTLLDNLARRGGLTRDMMQDLADAIAAFHAVAEKDTSCGSPAWLKGVIDGNERNLGLAGEGLLDAAAIAGLTKESEAEAGRLTALIEQRQRDGMVRLCHGDLHLRNICLIGGRPTLFDCVEFDRALACIDVLYDLSFLLMDLRHRGFPGWANFIFNRYFDMTGESIGARLLPLFMSVHAAIRSHVGLAAAKPRTNAPDDSQAYLDEALGMLEKAKPSLLAVGGASGAGKSTLAYGLAPLMGGATGARVLRSDVIRKRVMGVAPETRLPPESYTPAASRTVYEAMLREAGKLLQAGQTVVLDAVFVKKAERNAARDLAGNCGAPFRPVWLEAGTETRRQRVHARPRDASDATVAMLEAQAHQIERPPDWPVLEVEAGPDDVLARARAILTITP